MHVEDPRFPPLLTGHGVKAPLPVFETACKGVQAGRYGAADVVWARNTARIEMALVLEPEVARRAALQMVPLFELAVIEALGALMPPKTSVLLRWPVELLVNGGVAGRFRFSLAPCDDANVPDWMVVGVEIDLAGEARGEPGETRERTRLVDEGSGEHTRSDFLEVISAYALSWINAWQDGGQATFAGSWVGRVEGHEDAALLGLPGVCAGGGEPVKGRVLGLDDDARLLVKVADRDIQAVPIDTVLEAHANYPGTGSA